MNLQVEYSSPHAKIDNEHTRPITKRWADNATYYSLSFHYDANVDAYSPLRVVAICLFVIF